MPRWVHGLPMHFHACALRCARNPTGHNNFLHFGDPRNDRISFRLQGLKNEAECLGTPVQIIDHQCAVTCLVRRGCGIEYSIP